MKNKPQILILLVLFFQGIIYLHLGYDPLIKLWGLHNGDSMYTMTIARSWVHGSPLQITANGQATTILSDLLSPIFFSIGYWLGFKSLPAFILWAYLEYFLVAIGSCYFLWKFFKENIHEVALPATILCITFHGIYYNLYSTNFGFLFFFFWGALAYLNRFPVFMGFSILAGLMRPEGLSVYIFLSTLYILKYGSKNTGRLLLGIIPLVIPFFIYKHITGSILPQGVLPQNILNYNSVLESINIAFSIIADQIKGTLLGLYPSATPIGIDKGGWLGAFPPFLFIFSLLGLWKYNRKIFIPVLFYLSFLIIGDSFSIYAACHQNRHIHILAPFFIGYGLFFIRDIKLREIKVYNFLFAFFILFNLLQFFSGLSLIKSEARFITHNKDVADYLLKNYPEETVLLQDGAPLYWMDGRLDAQSYLTGLDPVLGRYVKYYSRLLEISEYIQRSYPKEILFVDSFGTDNIRGWLLQFKSRNLKSFHRDHKLYAQISLLDLTKIQDFPPYGKPFAELDVGDPVSEHEHNYKFIDSMDRLVSGPLQQGDTFWDGGRPNLIYEEFDVTVPVKGGKIVCRYNNIFKGSVIRGRTFSPVALKLPGGNLVITANDKTVFSGDVVYKDGFFLLEFQLPEGGENHIEIHGARHSFHYWIYESDD